MIIREIFHVFVDQDGTSVISTHGFESQVADYDEIMEHIQEMADIVGISDLLDPSK